MEAYRQYKAFASCPPPTPAPSSPTAHGSDEKPDVIWVAFEAGDPANPQNWSTAYKAWVIALLSWLTLSLTFASSVSAAAESAVMDQFGCGQVPATLTTGAFLIGMGAGAMPSAPLSELFGRLPVYAVTLLLATLFEVASAVAPTIYGLCILRFLAGFMSAAPLSNAGGSLNDIGNPVVRTITLPLFATTGFVGPVLGPVIGGFVVSSLSWRWVYWVVSIWNAACFLTTFTFMPETNPAALLRYKAMQLRKTTGDPRYRARIEEKRLGEATRAALGRPFAMLAVEPVVQFFVTYLTIVYVCLYGFFEAYPLVFMNAHALSLAQTGLAFLPIMVGFFVLLAGMLLHYWRYVGLAADARAGIARRGLRDGKVAPEERLVPLMLNAILLPAGLFWFAWTSPPRFSIWALMMSGIPFGIGLLSVFQASYQYMIDAYGPFAASALAGATLVRYVVSGIVILGIPSMYNNLGYEWATSLLAFLALAMVPVPFVFYAYGHRVRARCRFTVRD
ncbi:hypothetical protein Q5752_000731 [Cryptotrichosporon argae]